MKNQTKISAKEKLTPGYIKKVEQENLQLIKSLKSTQDVASSAQENNRRLDIQNSVLNERLKHSGWQTNVKDIGFVLLGSSIGYAIEEQFLVSTILLLIFAGIVFGVSIVDNLLNSKEKRGKQPPNT